MSKQVEVPELEHDRIMAERFGHKVSQDGKLERRIVTALIAHMEQKGFKVTGVWDGEAWEKADTAKEAMEFVFNLDDCSLRFTVAESFDREKHEKTRKFNSRNAYAKNEHGVLLVIGNGIDIINDWNYFNDDRDGFNKAMEEFNAEDYE